jgi:hypothetical protein
MGITILRANANTNNPDHGEATFPEIPQIKGDFLFWKASMAEEVEFIGLKSRKPVYFTPYVLGGINRFYKTEASAPKTEYKFEAGADFKYGLTSNLILDQQLIVFFLFLGNIVFQCFLGTALRLRLFQTGSLR